MACPLRTEFAEAYYHVIQRGSFRFPVFEEDSACRGRMTRHTHLSPACAQSLTVAGRQQTREGPSHNAQRIGLHLVRFTEEPDGSNPVPALHSDLVIASVEPCNGECYGAIQYCLLKSVLEVVGTDRFHGNHPRGTVFTIGSPGEEARYRTGTDPHELVPGDWVYFQNHPRCKSFFPQGDFQGENAVYVGHGRFSGLLWPRDSRGQSYSLTFQT